MKFKAILVASAAALTLAACAPTGRVSVVSNGEVKTSAIIKVTNGSTTMYKRISTLKPDCSSAGIDAVQVVKAPEHGTVNVVQTTTLASFQASSPFAKCNGRNVPATDINYVSKAGYEGEDRFELATTSPGGLKTTDRVLAYVR